MRQKTGGRKIGVQNKTSAETKEALQAILNKEFTNIPELLEQLTPKDKLDALIKMMPYIIPKQTELIQPENTQAVRPIIIDLGSGINPNLEYLPNDN